MSDQISERTIRLILSELLEVVQDGVELEKKIAWLSSVLRTRYLRDVSIHARCVQWYEKNAVEAFSSEPGGYTGLVAVLERMGTLEEKLKTIGGILSLSATGFESAGSADSSARNMFLRWVMATIPDNGPIMLGVFRHRGLGDHHNQAMIHEVIKLS